MKIVSILWFLWALSSSNGFNVKDVISNIRKFEDEITFQNDEVLGGPIGSTSKPEKSETVTDESPSIVTEAPLTCSSICSKEINQFKNNYTELAMAYFALHEEIEHLHKHIEHHDQILKHIALMSHRFHKKNYTQDELIKKPNETDERKFATQQILTDDLTANKKVENKSQHILSRDEVIQIAETNLAVEDAKKLDEGTKSYAPKLSLNIHHEIIQHQHNNLGKFFPHLHRAVHHHHIPFDHFAFEKRSNHKSAFEQSHEQIQKRLQTMDKEMKTYFISNDKLQGMEDSLMENNIYATCEVKANRHITLLNQQDISGRINLWQRKPNGPLQMHVKLKGFKIPSWNKDFPQHTREVRETIIVPIETVPGKPQDDSSIKNALSHMHGIHIHEFGNLTRDCQSTGSHYNPYGTTHGGPFDAVRHVGDLGNIRCDDNGEVDVELTFSHVSLTGEHSIVGRSIVIHALPDDYGKNADIPASLTTGNSGVRIGCCLIEEVAQLPPETTDSRTVVGSVAGPSNSQKNSEFHSSLRSIYQSHLQNIP